MLGISSGTCAAAFVVKTIHVYVNKNRDFPSRLIAKLLDLISEAVCRAGIVAYTAAEKLHDKPRNLLYTPAEAGCSCVRFRVDRVQNGSDFGANPQTPADMQHGPKLVNTFPAFTGKRSDLFVIEKGKMP